MRIMTNTYKCLFVAICFVFYTVGTVQAEGNLTMDANQSLYLNAGAPIDRIAVANPEIADVTVLSKEDMLVVAKKPGTTTLYIWTMDGIRQEYTVTIQDHDTQTSLVIAKMIGYPNIRVEKISDKVLLKGSVLNQLEKNRAEKIAEMYGAKVVDLLEMTHPSQIRLEAKIVEISTDKVKKLGIQYANASSIDTTTGIVTIGSTGVFGFGQTFSNTRDTSSSKLGGYADINATLQALITNGDAKILSQPSMITMSGEKANILVGGEIPIPTGNSDGQVTVEWREYGIKLNIEPQVDADNQITSKVQAEVSSLDSSNAVAVSSSISIPALLSRKAETVIHLSSGSTMVIGGLLSSNESKQVLKFPFLGDLPIIGQFFRSTTTSKSHREIIILVTPTLVDETTPTKMSDEIKKMLEDKK
ncbi:pilus assembly protein CpaC [Propionispira arboris]|uniref:Pilus assembly protein CpaC n=1 Tax=Propionispira arboris TaxID=84035 RepID=A0A1H7BTZ4_9FIRM|nr:MULTISPECIES: pilus assembly protein N-terminal domain-containing protein [Propionispira]SEJ79797.1 pilus assembly protein CpaC [Propionispira arboris]